MQIDTTHPSPNHSSRHGRPVTLLVMHATVGPYTGSLGWLCDPASRVSAHYLIAKTGHIAQLVAETEAAWHAGVSSWRGLDSTAIQLQSIGIELENLTGMIDPHTGIPHLPDPYPVAQLIAATDLCRDIIHRYGILPINVVRHLDIAPTRKSDPANLDWPAFCVGLFDPPLIRRYQVTTWLPVRVRSAASDQATILDRLWRGTVVAGSIVSGVIVQGDGRWLKLSDRPGFVWAGALQQIGA